MQRSWHSVLRLLTLCILIAALSGCTAVDRLTEILYPTPSVGTPTASMPTEPIQDSTATPQSKPEADPTTTPTVTPTFTVPAPTQTPNPEPTEEPTAAPTPESGQYIVYGHNTSILRADELGHSPVEVALVPQLESWDFYQGKLAIARKEYLQIVDLTQGELSNYRVSIGHVIEHSDVYWSVDGAGLLLVAMIEDSEAETLGRSVVLVSVSPDNGSILAQLKIQDVTRVVMGAFDSSSGQVNYIPLGDNPAFTRVDTVNVNTSQAVSASRIEGEGEAVFSPDGRYLLVEQLEMEENHNGLALYDLDDPEAAPITWLHPADSHSVSHVWSGRGRQIAFELRNGMTFDAATEGLGVWVLDIAAKDPIQVLNEPDSTSWLVGWSPHDKNIIGYHHSDEQSYYYAVQPDGGNLRILPMEEDAKILGWMPVTKGPVEKVVMDPWRIRFLDADGDPNTAVQIVADYVAANVQTDEAELSQQINDYLTEADWKLGTSQPSILRVDEGVFVAQLPSFTIYLLDSGQVTPLLYGEVLIDCRLEGDDLGVIFGTFSTDALQPAFALLHHEEDGTWKMIWMAQGRRDWITTNGQIRFSGEGLDELTVRGSSFGLDYDENLVFDECPACVQRSLQGIWERTEDGYARQSELDDTASRGDIYWEMTNRTAYATLYEALRRTRQELDPGELATQEALDQMRDLGLLEDDLILTVKDDTDYGVTFCAKETCWKAEIESGQVISLSLVP